MMMMMMMAIIMILIDVMLVQCLTLSARNLMF